MLTYGFGKIGVTKKKEHIFPFAFIFNIRLPCSFARFHSLHSPFLYILFVTPAPHKIQALRGFWQLLHSSIPTISAEFLLKWAPLLYFQPTVMPRFLKESSPTSNTLFPASVSWLRSLWAQTWAF